MGRIVTTGSILLLILALSLNGIWYAAQTREEMNAKIAEAEEWSRRQDQAELLRLVDALELLWKERESFLSFYVRHDEIEKMNTSLVNLRTYAEESAFDSVIVILEQMEFMTGHIYERELPNLDNLL